MQKLIYILMLVLLGFSSKSQEVQRPFQEVNQDDLGNVSDEFQENFFEALKQKGIENYEKAITSLEKCLQIDASNAVVYFELGKNYQNLKKYDEAVQNFQKAHELLPQKESILQYLLDTYKETGNISEGISTVQKLTKLDPKYEQDLIGFYILNEDYDKALAVIDKLDENLGVNAYRNAMRRQIYSRTNNTDAQISNLEKSIGANPEIEQNYLNLIYIYSENGEEKEAFRIAEELLETNPGSSLAHLALYKFYLDQSKTEKAITSMKIVFQSEEIDAESKFKVLNDFMNFVQKNPEYEKELIDITGKLSEWENTPQLYEQLGDYHLSKNNFEDALTFFELGIATDEDNFELLKKTLLLQLKAGKYESASNLTKNGLEVFPSQPLLYLLQGVALNNQDNYAAAAESLEEGLDYLIEDEKMEMDFYTELMKAYLGLNNAEKVNDFKTRAAALKKLIN
ncbi:tetratricopeptide repeat protein [Gramella sp. AN32]|uniref:Tetratricopeptide repeat protein n=1 Tax=Christiangramia antarctica TaxID=2058158 RepID=A0ABW5X043_9FLAO|nr:tetratricopeptide repeat protein [Gramella sp. AN32]MCM4155045.1 hypothetical protein [Gramella sp. AN32]